MGYIMLINVNYIMLYHVNIILIISCYIFSFVPIWKSCDDFNGVHNGVFLALSPHQVLSDGAMEQFNLAQIRRRRSWNEKFILLSIHKIMGGIIPKWPEEIQFGNASFFSMWPKNRVKWCEIMCHKFCAVSLCFIFIPGANFPPEGLPPWDESITEC